MLSFKKIAGFLKKVGSRDGGNTKEESGSSKVSTGPNTAVGSNVNGSPFPPSAGSLPVTGSCGSGVDGPLLPSAAASVTPILHGLPPNADTQAVLKHVYGVVSKKSQYVVDEAPWLLLAASAGGATGANTASSSPAHGSGAEDSSNRHPAAQQASKSRRQTQTSTPVKPAVVPPASGGAAVAGERTSRDGTAPSSSNATSPSRTATQRSSPRHGSLPTPSAGTPHAGGGRGRGGGSGAPAVTEEEANSVASHTAVGGEGEGESSSGVDKTSIVATVSESAKTAARPLPSATQTPGRTTPILARTLLPTYASSPTPQDTTQPQRRSSNLTSPKASPQQPSTRVHTPGMGNLLESLQRERAEMIEALDVCLQEVPDCDNELELVQHALDAMTVEQQHQMHLQQQQQRRRLQQQQQQQQGAVRERRTDSVASGHTTDTTNPNARLISPQGSATYPTTTAAAGEEQGSNQRTPLLRSHHHSRHHRGQAQTAASAAVTAEDDVGDGGSSDHNVDDDDARGREGDEELGFEDDDDIDAEEEELYPDDHSYIVDVEGDDDNDGSTVFSLAGPQTLVSGGATGVLSGRPSYVVGRSGPFAPATAVSHAAVLRAVAAHQCGGSSSGSPFGSQSITVYEWRLLLLQIVELLIGVDRAMYIELSQRAFECGTKRNAALREQLEKEVTAAAEAVTRAVIPVPAPGSGSEAASAATGDEATPKKAATTGVISPIDLNTGSGAGSESSKGPSSSDAPAAALPNAAAAPPPRATTHSAENTKAASNRGAESDGSVISPPPAAPTPQQPATTTATHPQGFSGGGAVNATMATPSTGMSTITTPTTHDLPPFMARALPLDSSANGATTAAVAAGSTSNMWTERLLLEVAATAAAASISPADIKLRKSLATATTRAIDDALGAACTLATWVALRAILRQHIAHLEEAAVKYAEAEASIASAAAAEADTERSRSGGAIALEGSADGSHEQRDGDEAESTGHVTSAASTHAVPATPGSASAAALPLPVALQQQLSQTTTSAAGMMSGTLKSAATTVASATGNWATYSSLPPAMQQEVQPKLKEAAHRVLSAATFPSVSVAWAEVVKDLQDLLGLPDANTAACIMCSSFLRDDGRELLLCMLQDPHPRRVLESILANRRKMQHQSVIDFLSNHTQTPNASVPASAPAAGASAGGGAGAATGGPGKGPTASASTTTAAFPSASPSPTTTPSSAAQSKPPTPTPTATGTGSSSALTSPSVGPARPGAVPPPLSTSTLAGTHVATAGAASAAAKSAMSPILSNRTKYDDDVVLDDILRDVERAYRDGVAKTWSEYLEKAIMVPFLKSIGVVPPTPAEESDNDDDNNCSEPGDQAGDNDVEVGDTVTNVDALGVDTTNPNTDAEDEEAAKGAGSLKHSPSQQQQQDESKRERQRQTLREKKQRDRATVAAKLADMLATDEGDSVLCQVATAYFFCSDEWGRAVRQDGFSVLYHHARQRVAVAKEKEDWAMGKQHASLATAVTQTVVTAEANLRRDPGGNPLHALHPLDEDLPGENRSTTAIAESVAQRFSSRASPGDGLLVGPALSLSPDSSCLNPAPPFLVPQLTRAGAGGGGGGGGAFTNPASEAGESSTYGSLRWSPFLTAAGTSSPQQPHFLVPTTLSTGAAPFSTGSANAAVPATVVTLQLPSPNTAIPGAEGSLTSATSGPAVITAALHGQACSPSPQRQQPSLAQQLYQQLLLTPNGASYVANFSMDQEMVERMLNMSWSAALHKRTEHCLAAKPPRLDEALSLAQQERSVANVFADFRARQRALASLVNVWLGSGKSREAYQVATKHFKNEKKEWTTHTQTMFTAIRYMQSMTQLVRAQAACHAHGAVIETGQFVLPQAALCEQMLQVLSPRPRGAFVLRFGDVRLKLLRAKIYLKKEIWRSYAAFDDAARAEKYFTECMQDICQLRKRLRDGEMFEALMERGGQLMQKMAFARSVEVFKLAVQLAKAAMEQVNAKQQAAHPASTTKAAAGPRAASGTVGAATSATAPAAPSGSGSEKTTQPHQPATAGSATALGANGIFHKDLHLRGAGSGSLTSAEEHGVHNQLEEDDLELPWRITESERMLALAYVMAAEHEVNVPERRKQLSNAVNNAYASQASLQRWQAKGGTPKRMLTAVPLSLVVVCKALLLLKQPKKAALLLEPLIEEKVNSAAIRPPMWKELLNATTDPLTAEDVVLRAYVNSVRLSVFLLYARCLARFDGERALRAVEIVRALIDESEAWMRAVQYQVRAAGKQIQHAKALAAAGLAAVPLGPMTSPSPQGEAGFPSVPSTRPLGRNTPLSVSVSAVITPSGAAAAAAAAAAAPSATTVGARNSNAAGAMSKEDGAENSVTSPATVAIAGGATRHTDGAQTNVPRLVARAPTTSSDPPNSPMGVSGPSSRPGTQPTTTSVPSLSPYTYPASDSSGGAGYSSFPNDAAAVVSPNPSTTSRLSAPSTVATAAVGTTVGAAVAGAEGAVTSGIRVAIESQSERVTAWRALWQIGSDLRKTTRDLCIVAGDALCLLRRWEDALESYSNALVICVSEEQSAAEREQQKSAPVSGAAGGATNVSSSRRATASRSASVCHITQPVLEAPLQPGSSPVKLFDEADLAWLQEDEEELDSAIADVHSPVSTVAMHDLRAVIANEVRRDYKASENRVLEKLADVYKALDKPKVSIHYLKLVQEYAAESKDALLEYTSTLQLARLYTFTDAVGEAQETWEHVSTLAKQYEDKEVTRETLRNMISGQIAAGMFPTVVETAAELNTLASEGEGTDAAADKRFALEALANAHLQLAHYKECLDALDAREKVQERSGEWNGNLLELRARARLGMGENAEGIKVLLSWANKARQMRNAAELAHANVVLSGAYAAQGAIYRARRCHLSALRALSMLPPPLSTECRERVLESARWLVHYYYLSVDQVQVDPSLKDTRPPPKVSGKGTQSMFVSNSSSSFEHDLHNNSGDLAAILEEDERMRAERAAAAESAETPDDDDDVESFLGNITGSSFAGIDMNALLAGEADKGAAKSEGSAKEKEKASAAEAAAAPDSDTTAEKEKEPQKTPEKPSPPPAAADSKKAPAATASTKAAAPASSSGRPAPPPTTIANVSICSRPAAAAAGTDVLESIPHLEHVGISEPSAGGAGTALNSNSNNGSSALSIGGGSRSRGSQASSTAITSGSTAGTAASPLAPLTMPDDLNYQSPATISTLCYNSAIETMEWATRLLFLAQPPQPQPQPQPTSSTESGAAGTQPNQAQMRQLSESTAIPYSPAEAVDFALLAFPRCTFVFYFAEYAMASSSCYDVIIRPANHSSFIHRSAQVTTLKNFHDRNVLQRVSTSLGAGQGNSSKAASITNSNLVLGMTAQLPPSTQTSTADVGGNPMLSARSGGGGQPSLASANQPPPRLTGNDLIKALSKDNMTRFYDLHDELWVPVVSGLKRAKLSLEDAECLIIVADPTLMNAPFAALLPSPDNCMPGDSEEPVGVQITTLVTPSLSHLVYRGLTRQGSGRHRGRHHCGDESPYVAVSTPPPVVNTVFLFDEEDGTGSVEPAAKPLSAGRTSRSVSQVATSSTVLEGSAKLPPQSPQPPTSASSSAVGGTPLQQPQQDPSSTREEKLRDPFFDLYRSSIPYTDDAAFAIRDDSSSSGSSSSSLDEDEVDESPSEEVEWGSGSYDCTGCGEGGEDDDVGRANNAGAAAPVVTGVYQPESHHTQSEPEQQEGILGARWLVRSDCTRKEFIRGFSDPASRVVVVLAMPDNGVIRVADGFVGMQDLFSSSRDHSLATATTLYSTKSGNGATAGSGTAPTSNGGLSPAGSAASSNHTSPARSRANVAPTPAVVPTSGAASPRHGSTSASLAASTSAAAPMLSTGTAAGSSAQPQGFVQTFRCRSLSHLDLFVMVVDRGVIPVATEMVSPSKACLQYGCPRVLRVDVISGTSITREHKEFIVLYLTNLERAQRWRMAYPYALALRMTLDAAIHEKEWPAVVWGAFTLVGAP